MLSAKRLRDALNKAILTPKISETKLAEKIDAIKRTLPIPVIWLLGKAQAGKTSLIRALTGRDDTEIGNGFQPCTRTARLYDFPNAQHCLIRFLDTRGLGEVNYDPAEDMRLFMQQAHLLMVVIKAMDHAQQGVLQALWTILKAHPQWPVIVVQTVLHEGYPDQDTRHLEPYPYAQTPWPWTVPQELARSLLKQREWFADIEARFVAVDFTLPEDGYTPVNYGIDALWAAIEMALPLGLQAMLQNSEHLQHFQDIYAKTAHPHILTYAVLAGGLEAIPIPMASVPFVLSLQAKMMQAIASIYNQELNWQRYAEIAGTLGLGYLLRLGGRELIKFIPVYGAAVSSVYTAGVTYALGKTLCAYFSSILKGDVPHKAVFEKIYVEELQKGRELLARYVRAIQP
jgi:Uncharacterized protein/domain associated with GTPases